MRALDTADRLSAHVGSTAEHDGTCDATRSQKIAVTSIVAVIAIRNGLLAVDLGINNCIPVVIKIARELIAHAGHIKGERSRHNHRRRILVHPQLVDNRCH